MKSTDFVLRKLLLAATISTAAGTLVLPAGCARKPKDKIAHGETENLYTTSDLLGSKSTFKVSTSLQDFTRKSFDRVDGEWLALDQLSDIQKRLIAPVRAAIEAKLEAAGTKKIRFTATKDMLFLGLEGYEKKTFSYAWHIDGFYNLRQRKTAKGEGTSYYESAQEGTWFDRGMIRISPNAIVLPVKISDAEARFVFARADLEGSAATFVKHTAPNGLSLKGWENVYNFYANRIPEGAKLQTRIVNNSLRVYWEKATTDGRTTLVEIAHVSAKLGFLDYDRDGNNTPTSSALRIVAGESSDPSLYDAIELTDELYPQVTDSSALAFKQDYLSAKKLGDLPNLEIQAKIIESLKPAVVTADSEIVVSLNEKNLDVTVVGIGGAEGTTFRWSVSSNENYSGIDNVSCLACLTQEGSTAVRLPLVTISSDSAIDIPTSKKESLYKALEFAMQKKDVKDKTYLYYPIIVDSSTADPSLGGGQTPYGHYGEGAEQRKVIFSFDRDYLTVKNAPGSVKSDPNNNDLPILKFPIKAHFNLRYDAVKKTYFREDASNWQNAEYVDVDLSNNLLTNYFDDILALYKSWGAYEPGEVAELLPEPLNKGIDAPNKYLFIDNSPNSARMVSFLTQYSLTPVQDPYYDTFASPITMKIRHGFRELNGDGSYKPRPYDFYDYHTFKVFTSKTYKPQDDLLEDKAQDYREYANTYDVDPARGKSVTYHLNRDFPAEYCSTAFAAADAWNKAFQKAYNNTSFTFVKLAEATAEELKDPIYRKFDRVCKKPDGSYAIPAVREVGDLRTNMIVLFTQNMDNGLAGFGPALHHPDSGEVLSASSFQYEGAMRMTKQRASTLWDYMQNAGDYNAFVRLRTKWMDPENLGVDFTGTVVNVAAAPAQAPAGTASLFAANDDDMFAPIAAKNLPSKVQPVQQIKPGSAAYRDLMSMITSQLLEVADINDQALTTTYLKSFAHVLGRANGVTNSAQIESKLKSIVDRRLKQNESLNNAQDRSCNYAAGFNPTSGGDFFREMLAKKPNITKEEFVREASQRYFFSTTVHEMGHNFGFAHNFKGSVDKNNYPKEFQDLNKRTDLSEGEAARKTNLASSTVMEYMPGFVGDFYEGTESNKGSLGPYDIGAVTYLYAGQMEVNKADAPGADYDSTYTGRISRQMYRETLQGILNASNADVQNKADAPYNFVDTARGTLKARPYMFCTNGDNSLDEFCATFDTGSSPSEIVQNAIESYETGFQVGSINYGQKNAHYVQGIGQALDRSGRSFASRIKQFFDFYDYINSMYPGIPADYVIREGFTMGDYKKAVVDGLTYLQKIVKAPAGASMTVADGGPALNIPLELARDDYSISRNLNGQTLPIRAGTMFEKLSIISLLVAPTRSSKVLYDNDGKMVDDIWTPVSSSDPEIRAIAGEIMSDLMQGSAKSTVNAVVDGEIRQAVVGTRADAQPVEYSKNFLLDIPVFAQIFVGYHGKNHAFGNKLDRSMGYEKYCGNMSDTKFTIPDSQVAFDIVDYGNTNCIYRFAKEDGIGLSPVFQGVRAKIQEAFKTLQSKVELYGKSEFTKDDLLNLSPQVLIAKASDKAKLEADAVALFKGYLTQIVAEGLLPTADANAKAIAEKAKLVLPKLETVKTLAEAFDVAVPAADKVLWTHYTVFFYMTDATFAEMGARPDLIAAIQPMADYYNSVIGDPNLDWLMTSQLVLNYLANHLPEADKDAYKAKIEALRYLASFTTDRRVAGFYANAGLLYSASTDENTRKLGNYLGRLEKVKSISNGIWD